MMFTIRFNLLYVVGPFQLVELMYFFMAVIIAVVTYIAFYLVRRARRSARRKQLRERYSGMISQLAICETPEELEQTAGGILKELRSSRLLDDKFSRNTLIRELVTAAKSMNGTARSNISHLYTITGLDQVSLAQLRSASWHVQGRAIQTLAHLNQKQHITKIYRHTNHSNELIRNEARVAVVKLTGFEGLRFLDVISYPLTEWEQLSLLHELSENHQPIFKEIPNWLHSDNDSVVEFALGLVESYRIFEMHGDVTFCLAHQRPFIRKKAVQTIKAINQPMTPALLVAQLLRDEEEVQLVVLEAMGEVGSENELSALWPFLSHPRTVFKIAAARAIRNSHPYGLLLLKQQVDAEIHPWDILLPQLEEEVKV